MNATQPHKSLIGRTASARAYAKLNLRLKIVGRREDGFHLLSMLNNEISLCDEVSIRIEEQPGIRFESTGIGSGGDFFDPTKNLATRAAQLYLEQVKSSLGLSLRLRKAIPIGAGLGGGSSDAGAVLRLLHQEFGAESLSPESLSTLAASIGSDVPYFLERGACHVSGTGERVRRLRVPALRGATLFLFVPAVAIATPQLYAFYRKKHPVIPNLIDEALVGCSEDRDLSYREILALIENDFEALLKEFSPGLWREIGVVRSGAGLRVGLTGSGSSYFGLPESNGEGIAQIVERLTDLLRPSATKVLPLRFVDADEE